MPIIHDCFIVSFVCGVVLEAAFKRFCCHVIDFGKMFGVLNLLLISFLLWFCLFD
jgi:hypothetical protein